MKKIKLLGSKPRKHPFPIVSWAIRLIELSDISHVGILFPEERRVFNAHFDNIKFEDLNDYYENHNVIYNIDIEVSDDQYRSLIDFKNKILGDQEGYWCTLLGALIPHIVRTLSFGMIHLPNFAPKGYTCSWLFREVVNMLGMPDSLMIDQKIHPANFSTKDSVKLAKKIEATNEG